MYGICYVDGTTEKKWYIDKEILDVYKKNPQSHEKGLYEKAYKSDIKDIHIKSYVFDKESSDMERYWIIGRIASEMTSKFKSFSMCNKTINGKCVIAENSLFFVAVENKNWGLGIELIEKGEYGDNLRSVLCEQYAEVIRNALENTYGLASFKNQQVHCNK